VDSHIGELVAPLIGLGLKVREVLKGA